jgi:hypothetical protein
MPRVGFEVTTREFERARTVHALGRVTHTIGLFSNYYITN